MGLEEGLRPLVIGLKCFSDGDIKSKSKLILERRSKLEQLQ